MLAASIVRLSQSDFHFLAKLMNTGLVAKPGINSKKHHSALPECNKLFVGFPAIGPRAAIKVSK